MLTLKSIMRIRMDGKAGTITIIDDNEVVG